MNQELFERITGILPNIREELIALGPQPLNDANARLDHSCAIMRIGKALEAVPGIVPARNSKPGQYTAALYPRYDSRTGELYDMWVDVTYITPDRWCRGTTRTRIPFGPEVDLNQLNQLNQMSGARHP